MEHSSKRTREVHSEKRNSWYMHLPGLLGISHTSPKYMYLIESQEAREYRVQASEVSWRRLAAAGDSSDHVNKFVFDICSTIGDSKIYHSVFACENHDVVSVRM